MRTIQITISDMDNPNKALLVLSNSIAEARYNLSMPTQKLLLFLISKITYEERKQGIFLNTLEVTFKELKDFFKMTGRNNNKNLLALVRDIVKELDTNSINIQEVGKNDRLTWKSYPWRSISIFNEDTGIFTCELLPLN